LIAIIKKTDNLSNIREELDKRSCAKGETTGPQGELNLDSKESKGKYAVVGI
jgi:hypothetical protein